jgi:hypothetical protein
MAEPDPVYAVLEACRRMPRVIEWYCDKLDRLGQGFDYVSDCLMKLLQDFYKKLAETEPTTAAGMAAKIAFVKEAPVPNPFVLDGENILLADHW